MFHIVLPFNSRHFESEGDSGSPAPWFFNPTFWRNSPCFYFWRSTGDHCSLRKNTRVCSLWLRFWRNRLCSLIARLQLSFLWCTPGLRHAPCLWLFSLKTNAGDRESDRGQLLAHISLVLLSTKLTFTAYWIIHPPLIWEGFNVSTSSRRCGLFIIYLSEPPVTPFALQRGER